MAPSYRPYAGGEEHDAQRKNKKKKKAAGLWGGDPAEAGGRVQGVRGGGQGEGVHPQGAPLDQGQVRAHHPHLAKHMHRCVAHLPCSCFLLCIRLASSSYLFLFIPF